MKSSSQETESFYDALAPTYHLIYPDWNASIQRQASGLDGIIGSLIDGSGRTVLDAACGIGTQALGLAALGYELAASDFSAGEIARAREEAIARGLEIDFAVCDMRRVGDVWGRDRFDVVMACDNSVPHLLCDKDIREAFQAFYDCARPGGVCLVSVRDYDVEPKTGTHVRPTELRTDEDGRRVLLTQVWEFDNGSDGPVYDLSLYLTYDHASGDGGQCPARVLRSRYYAVRTGRLMELMKEAGWQDVARRDGEFYQPVLVGRKPATDS